MAIIDSQGGESETNPGREDKRVKYKPVAMGPKSLASEGKNVCPVLRFGRSFTI